MNQERFEQLLAWTMLSAHNGSVIEQQNILGRDLTSDEYKACYAQTQKNADLIRDQLRSSGEKHGK